MGAQADQFLHAYYYRVVRGDLGEDRVDRAFAAHVANPDAALVEAMQWWKNSEFDYGQEKSMLLESAPRMQQLLSKNRLLELNREEFVDALSRVHAILEYGGRRKNLSLGLTADRQDRDLKTKLHVGQLWESKTKLDSKTPLEVLYYLIWGPGETEKRIWDISIEPAWRLPWVQINTLTETLGWARPDDFPPRNDRTLKGLRSLGYIF